jgi:hypothetical protein
MRQRNASFNLIGIRPIDPAKVFATITRQHDQPAGTTRSRRGMSSRCEHDPRPRLSRQNSAFSATNGDRPDDDRCQLAWVRIVYCATAATTGSSSSGGLSKSGSASSGQEQSQMMISVKGAPTPRAPPIINANAESKFSSTRNSRLDMTLLH